MRSAIDAAGRVVIPKAIRDRAHLSPGLEVSIRYEDGLVIVEPAPVPVRLERRGRFVVARPQVPGESLSAADVEETTSRVRLERDGRPSR